MFEKRDRWWDPVSVTSLLILAYLTSITLEATNWTPDLDRIPLLSLSGLFFGFLIGHSKYKRYPAYFLMGIYSFAIVFLLGLIPLSSDPEWMDRILIYLNRIIKSIDLLLNNSPLDDSVIFWTFMAVIFWSTSMIAAFSLARTGQSKLTALIFAVIFFSIQFYLPTAQRNFLLVFLFSLILLFYLSRLFYVQKANQWKEKGVKEDREVVWSLSRNVIITSLIILTFSWSMVLVVEKVSENKKGQSGTYPKDSTNSLDFINNLLNPLKRSSEFGIGDFPENLTLGESRSLKEDIEFIMSVPLDEGFSSNYYWKGRTYSSYKNGLWTNKENQVSKFSELKFLPFPSPNKKIFSYRIEYFRENKIIFTPSFGVPVGIDAKISFFSADNNQQDISYWGGIRTLRIGDKIEILGYSNEYSGEELLNTSTNYPVFVREHYLFIPEVLKEKALVLANSIVPENGTILEKATIINKYLRDNYVYRDVVEIPENMDPVEWFLFDGKQGFCNYFASAEVLLLRSLGIPSRLVVGYSQGEKINNQQYLVQIKDSHAWVEIFFPDVGWVIFEPTPTFPDLKYEENELEKGETGIGDAAGAPPTQIDKNSGIPKNVEIYKDLVDSRNNLKEQFINLFLAWIILLLVTLILIYMFVFHENRMLLIPVLEKAFEKTGAKVPAWLKKWSAYEKLPTVGKKMKKIRQISTLLVGSEEALTSKELFEKLDQLIIGKSKEFKFFLDAYHQAEFGEKKINDTYQLHKAYKTIIGSILAVIAKQFISKLISRKNPSERD